MSNIKMSNKSKEKKISFGNLGMSNKSKEKKVWKVLKVIIASRM
jgi:hypothetical protein